MGIINLIFQMKSVAAIATVASLAGLAVYQTSEST